jgi:hypothetical protein
MKKFNFLKVGVIFSLLLFLYSNLSAQQYILNDDKLIDDRAKEKINQIGDEIISTLEKPYVLLSIAVEETHVNLLFSDDFKSVLDKDDILDGYVVPLLASKDKNTLFAKVSAATLNGYAAIADIIAESKQIKLESSIGNAGKISSTIWRVVMYTLVVLGLLAYTYAVLKRRK